MMNPLPSRSLLKKLISAALAPLFVFTSVFGALPASAVDIIRTEPVGEAAVGVRAVPTLDVGRNLPVLAPPAIDFSAAAVEPALSAAADWPISSVNGASEAPASASDVSAHSGAAASAKPTRFQAESQKAFRNYLKRLAKNHEPLADKLAGSGFFDGAADRGTSTAGRLGVLPHRSLDFSSLLPRPRALTAAQSASFEPVVLDADAKNMASIEAAVRALVDSNPAQFNAPSSQMAATSVDVLPSIVGGHAASVTSVFRQVLTGIDKDGSPYQLEVAGHGLTFHVKIFDDGKATVMKTSGALASGVTSDVMTVKFDDAQLLSIAAKAARSAKSPARAAKKAASAQPAAPQFVQRMLTNDAAMGGLWRAVNVYQAQNSAGASVIVAVDVKSGEPFTFNSQDLHTGGEAKKLMSGGKSIKKNLVSRMKAGLMSLISGTVDGRATTLTAAGDDNGPIGPVMFPLTNVYDQSGNVVAETDENGSFIVPGDGTEPVTLTIKLASPLVPVVKDEDAAKNGPVQVTFTATPGKPMTVELNPVSDNPELADSIVGYVAYLKHHIFLKSLPGMNAARMDIPLAGGMVVNGHEEKGNAFYNPANDSVNLMAAASIVVRGADGKPVKLNVENTASWSIEWHESTHRYVQIFSQIVAMLNQPLTQANRFVKWLTDPIMGADVNESIADIVSYFMRGVSTIGAGFYEGHPPAGQPDYIRSALDKTKYDANNPDPHNGVLAQSMWMIREAFIAKYGQEQGRAFANAMIPVIILFQPFDPIDALSHLILWSMQADGSSPFDELIRKIAHDDHAIVLPATATRPGVPMS